MKLKKILESIWNSITRKIKNKPLGFSCCFCAQSIMSSDKYPADLHITVNIDKTDEQQHDQFFFCHTECFKNKLHSNIQSYFTLEHIDEDNKI